MKRRTALSVGGVLCILVAVAGCTTTPVERQERAVTGLADTQREMTDIRQQIEQTLASLITLVNAPPDELRPAYDRYASDVEAMRTRIDAMERHASAMRQRSERYLTGWRQSDVQDPELREISTERRQEVAERMQRVDASFQEARAALVPFQSNLEDIRKVVGQDPTPGGVSAVAQSEVLQNAQTRGAAVARLMDRAIADFEQLVERLGPTARR